MVQFFLIWKHVFPNEQKEPLGGRLRYFRYDRTIRSFHELSCFLAAIQTLSISPFREIRAEKKRGITFRLRFSKEKSSTFKVVLDMIRFRKRFVSIVAFRFPLYSPFVFEGFFFNARDKNRTHYSDKNITCK